MTEHGHLLNVAYLAPEQLTADPMNPRTHNSRHVSQLVRSIQAFGFVAPILIDATNMVIAGHGRLAAALRLKMAAVPTIRLEHLSDAQRRAYMITDNRLSETSRWDEGLLATVIHDLSLADLEFDIEVIGFSTTEIDLRVLELEAPADTDPADAFKPPKGPTVSRSGDLFRLGKHRLLCGSALDEADFARLMAGDSASMIFTDPPFNVAIGGHVSGLGRVEHREFAMASGEMDRESFTRFLASAMSLMVKNSRSGSMHYVMMDWRHISEMLSAGEASYTELKNLCVWAKDRGGMGSLYRSAHELVFLWKSGQGRHRNNVELGKNGRNRTNVWQYPAIAGFRRAEEGDLLAMHPTVKPVRLVADAILDVTRLNEIVLDPFMGSGTTLIAAERVRRRAYGMELDPGYIDTIIGRYQLLTGNAAIHVETGQTFAELSASRHPTMNP